MKPTILKNMNLLAIVAMLFLSACTNLEKALDKGDYDLVVKTAVKKLRGKTKKKAKYVTALEEGFREATELDMARIASLKRRNSADAWEKIHHVALDIKRRQHLVKPLLPVIDREGYKANFKFVKVDGIINESSDMASNLLYDEARTYLALAQNGDKNSARRAYDIFQKIKRYDSNYKDVITLSHEAHELGIVHVGYRVNNHSNDFMPRTAVDRLRNINTHGMNTFWQKIYLGSAAKGVALDYELNLNVKRIEMSPGLVHEKEFVEKREVQVGFRNKVVKNESPKDSLAKAGSEKTIKEPVFQWVTADVIRIIQKREAFVHATMVVKDMKNGGVVSRKNLSSSMNFENCYIEFFGDERALSSGTRKHLNNRPLPFPSDKVMLTDAACQMVPKVGNEMKYLKLS